MILFFHLQSLTNVHALPKLGGPIFKKSSQNFPPDPYTSLYTFKTTACKILKHFDNFVTQLFVCPFSGIYFNPFLSKIRKNSVFLIIFSRLAIILDFTALWAIKNEEMAIVWKLFSELHVYSCFCQILKIHWKSTLFFSNSPFLRFSSLREL